MNRYITASVSALALVLVTTAGVRADALTADTVGWTYNFSVSPMGNKLMGSQGGYLYFDIKDNGQGAGSGTANGTSNVVASNTMTSSAAAGSSPETLLANTFTTTMQLSTLEPNVANATATLNFAVSLQGKKAGDAPTFSANNANIFLATFTPLAGTGVTIDGGVAKVTLGSYTFAVSSPSFTPPGPSSQHNEGSMSVLVTVTDAGNGGAAQVPEPSAILLSCLGGLSFAGAAWRKRKAAR